MITIPRWLYIIVRLFPGLCKHWDVIDVGDGGHKVLACLDCEKILGGEE